MSWLLFIGKFRFMSFKLFLIREQGKLKEAVKLLLEVLEIREKTNGRDHQMV